MKNLIRVLLYVLLGLLVVAIAMVIYKKSANRAEVAETTTDQVDSLFVEAQPHAMPMSPEDSMILELTGELPSQTGTMDNVNSTIDYSEPVSKQQTTSAPENTSPKAQTVSNKVVETKITKESAPTTKTNTEKKSTPAKTEAVKKTSSESKPAGSAKTSSTGKFYAIAGSFIVPSHADKLVEKLKKSGFKTSARKVFGDSEYYSVVAGQYASREEASKAIASLKSKGYKDAFVKTN